MPRVSKSPRLLKVEVMQACVTLFNQKGLKFTMDDVSKHCKISKKTLYLIFDDKEALFLAMVDHVFDKVKESEMEVVNNPNLTTEEKIRKVLGVLPEGYAEVDFAQLYSLRDKYPIIYDQVAERLETGWETSLALLEQGQREGIINPDIHVPLVKLMYEATLEKFFQRDVLVKNGISYNDALSEVVEILLGGISK